MTNNEKKHIIELNQERDGSCNCGLCGKPLGQEIKFISKVTSPASYLDFIPIHPECRADFGGHTIESYRAEIQQSVFSFLPYKHTKKYLRALAYGMPDIKAQELKVRFYFETRLDKITDTETFFKN